jgi:hypothetical protein
MARSGLFRGQKVRIDTQRRVPQQPLLEEIEERFSTQREFEGFRSTGRMPKEEQRELIDKLKIAIPNPENTQYPKTKEVIDAEKKDWGVVAKMINLGTILMAPILYLLNEMAGGNTTRALISFGATIVFWGAAIRVSPEESSEKIIKKLFDERERIKVANKLLASGQVTDEEALAEVEKIAKLKGVFHFTEEVVRKIAKRVEVAYKAPIAGIIVTTMVAQRIEEMSDLAQGAVFLAAAIVYGIIGAVLTKREINKAKLQCPKENVRVEWGEEREEEPAYRNESKSGKKGENEE